MCCVTVVGDTRRGAERARCVFAGSIIGPPALACAGMRSTCETHATGRHGCSHSTMAHAHPSPASRSAGPCYRRVSRVGECKLQTECEWERPHVTTSRRSVRRWVCAVGRIPVTPPRVTSYFHTTPTTTPTQLCLHSAGTDRREQQHFDRTAHARLSKCAGLLGRCSSSSLGRLLQRPQYRTQASLLPLAMLCPIARVSTICPLPQPGQRIAGRERSAGCHH